MTPNAANPEITQAGVPAGGDAPKHLSFSRDLGEFLIEFSIALNRTVMYPEGHPSLDNAAAVVVQHLASILYERSTLSIGVAHRQLIIDGIATDNANPVLRSLAERLHQHHIGAITFRRGLTPREVLDALNVLGAEHGSGAQPAGLGNASRLTVGPHLRLYPLTYEKLEMTGEAEPAETEGGDTHRNSRIASLWIGMARAALANETTDGEKADAPVEPTAVARAINEHPSTQAYDQVIVGYLLQIAGELKTDGGTTSAAVRRHVSRLIDGLNEGALDRLIGMGGDLAQRHSFLLDALDGMAADAVVDLTRAAGRASNRSLSEPLLRVLGKLATVAESSGARAGPMADSALRDEVRRLISDWTAEGASPSYAAALDASVRLPGTGNGVEDSDRPEPVRLLRLSLALDAYGPPVGRALDALVASGELDEVVRVLHEARPGEAQDAAWARLAGRENIVRVLTLDSLEPRALQRLLDAADPDAVATALIDAIGEGSIPPDHPNALTAMLRLGPQITAEAGRRLSDESADVRRGMLEFLNESGIVPPGISPLGHATDPEPLIRREAVRLALLLPDERDRAIGIAIRDPDARIVHVGVRAIETGIPESLIPLVAGRTVDPALPMDLLTGMVRALGTVRSVVARDTLLRVATAGTTFLGRPRLAARSPAMLAGLAGLASLWNTDAKAAPVLKRARAASDAPTRAAAKGTES